MPSVGYRNSWIFGGTPDIDLRVLPAVPVEGWDVKHCAGFRDAVRQKMIEELERLRADRDRRPPHGSGS